MTPKLLTSTSPRAVTGPWMMADGESGDGVKIGLMLMAAPGLSARLPGSGFRRRSGGSSIMPDLAARAAECPGQRADPAEKSPAEKKVDHQDPAARRMRAFEGKYC